MHDPARLYAFALREGDIRLAELLYRRLAHRLADLLTQRVIATLRCGRAEPLREPP